MGSDSLGLGFEIATLHISYVEFRQKDLQRVIDGNFLYAPENKVLCSAIEFLVQEAPELVGEVIETRGNIIITRDKCFMAIENKNVQTLED